jgi:hypothetical protein
MYNIYLSCNWADNQSITNFWKLKLDKDVPIELTTDKNSADYYVIFNAPYYVDHDLDPKKTILIRMEPYMKQNSHIWGEWSNPDYSKFFCVLSHPETLSFIEWHLNKSFDELLHTDFFNFKKCDNVVSVIISDRYQDEGQIKRVNFIRYLQENHSDEINLHIYGRGNVSRFGIKNHIKGFPPHCKDDGIIPYKYHFNCENSFFMNYITEKLYDGIMGEAFTFYGGATNTCSVYPLGGFELLNMDNFELSAQTMIKMIKDNTYEKEYQNVKQLKKLILKHYTFSNRLYNIIKNGGKDNLQPLYENDIETVIQYNMPSTPPPTSSTDELITQSQLSILLENHSTNGL